MTRRLAGAAIVVVVLVAGAWVVAVRSDGDGEVPSPLFGDVEQLTPTSLPDGWARCGGGPSTRSDAKDRWWAQTFGPDVDGECTPLVTVIQVPPDDPVKKPAGTTNGGIGEEPGRTGAQHWSDEEAGSRGLYTTGSGGLQRLVIEGCCDPEATDDDFLHVAEAARDATREDEPARCTALESDLDQESFIDNYFGRLDRVYDEEGCPLRRDIVSWRTEPPTAHCFAGTTFLTVGTPVGAPVPEGGGRHFVRDPSEALDFDAELPPSAIDTGYRKDGASLWVDRSDDSRVYIVEGDDVEAWLPPSRMYACA